MTYCSIKVDLAKASEIKDFYQAEEIIDEKHPYDYFFVNKEGVAIHGYRNKKEIYTITFSGEGERPFEMASLFSDHVTRKDMEVKEKQEKVNIKEGWEDFHAQIGSDEVGKGDFFGPLIVVAAFVEQRDIPYLEKMRINDSKKMKDDYILEIGPRLVKEFAYSSLSLDNETYNKVHNAGTNMNAIKAKMHNKALLNLKKRYPLARVYQDQFAEPKLYYSYLKYEDEVLDDITFSTKGELAFPSVALASVLARYSFLRKMQELSKKYKMEFPFGSGKDADEFIAKFVEKYGKEELKKVAKLNFKNFKDLA
jgi:ribonuclease HIII